MEKSFRRNVLLYSISDFLSKITVQFYLLIRKMVEKWKLKIGVTTEILFELIIFTVVVSFAVLTNLFALQ